MSNYRDIKKIINNPDVLYPHEQFPGIILKKDEFVSFADFLEMSRQETMKKYITLRDIANSIINKNGILQGMAYQEDYKPKLTLLFRSEYPLDYRNKKKTINKKDEEELKLEKKKETLEDRLAATNIDAIKREYSQKLTDVTGKLSIKIDERQKKQQELENALKEYQDLYKDKLDIISRFNSPEIIKTRGGVIIGKEDEASFEEKFSGYVVTEDILEYLLNSANLTSEIEIEFVSDYYNELMRYQEAIKRGILYTDFEVWDYTGNISISTNHTDFIIFKQENGVNIPKDFGSVKIDFNAHDFSDHQFNLEYRANDDEYTADGCFNDYVLLKRGYIHKALLPENYRKY